MTNPVRMVEKKIEGVCMSKLKKSRPPWWLCSHKRRLFTVSHKIRFFASNSSTLVSSFVDGGAPRSSISAKIHRSIGTGCGYGKKKIPKCISETMAFLK
uniref:Uncharacterized protein n=1 Tax=Aegilops tauschii subsp. strangulata TaxID=200361 RepID=A0A453NVL6_AEGTS